MIFDVAMGRTYNTYECDHEWDKKDFHKNYDSVHAHAGKCLRNDEIICYNEKASCIRYLVEIH